MFDHLADPPAAVQQAEFVTSSYVRVLNAGITCVDCSSGVAEMPFEVECQLVPPPTCEMSQQRQ